MHKLKPPAGAEIFETNLITFWFGPDGILYSITKPAERSRENYNELFGVYKNILKDGREKFCMLCDVTKTSPLSKDVRDYISVELPKYYKALALVSNSPMGKTIGTFFTTVNARGYPAQNFDTTE